MGAAFIYFFFPETKGLSLEVRTLHHSHDAVQMLTSHRKWTSSSAPSALPPLTPSACARSTARSVLRRLSTAVSLALAQTSPRSSTRRLVPSTGSVTASLSKAHCEGMGRGGANERRHGEVMRTRLIVTITICSFVRASLLSLSRTETLLSLAYPDFWPGHLTLLRWPDVLEWTWSLNLISNTLQRKLSCFHYKHYGWLQRRICARVVWANIRE